MQRFTLRTTYSREPSSPSYPLGVSRRWVLLTAGWPIGAARTPRSSCSDPSSLRQILRVGRTCPCRSAPSPPSSGPNLAAPDRAPW